MKSEPDNIYRQAAQQLIDFDAAIASEYAGKVREPESVDTARRLYERHGPFKLNWDSNWWSSPPEWYTDHDEVGGTLDY